mmetsp:Transcript_7659/g.24102  ORF Transcript_7659/g.24102 Transcript_7659/m.24102 type:complete len:120 (-) Transcript_7659:128-487(-)
MIAQLKDNRLYAQYRRREAVDARSPDDSALAVLPLDVISRVLVYLPSKLLADSIKTVSARYRELAVPVLTSRLLWLERELAHDIYAPPQDLVTQQPFYRELERLCAVLRCRTYIDTRPF